MSDIEKKHAELLKLKIEVSDSAFRIKQLQKKGVSKSKKVNRRRILKMFRLFRRHRCAIVQFNIVQSQPIAPNENIPGTI